ncbi:MAG: PilN domain-containing protein [Nitrospiria bacterium]
MKSRAALGLYFAPDKISLLAVRQVFGKVRVKGVLSLALPRPDEEAAFYGALEDFLKKTHLKKSRVCVGLPRKEAVLVTLTLPAPAEENLREVLGYELDRHTPYSREEACFGFQIIGRDETQNTISVLLAAVLKKRLAHCFTVLENLGLTPSSIEISTTALLTAALFESAGLGQDRQVLVYLEKDGAEISLIDGHTLRYSRALPLISEEAANDLSHAIEHTLTYKGWRKDAVKTVRLAGHRDEDRQDALLKNISESLGCRGETITNLPPDPNGDALTPDFIIPLGLALNGLSDTRASLSLLPTEEAATKPRNGLQSVFLFIIALLLGGAVLFTPLIQGKKVLAELNEQAAALRHETGDLAGLEKEIQGLEAKLNQLVFVRDDRLKALRITHRLTESIPKNTWLTDLRYKENTVEIAGYSKSASALIPILERSPLFAEVAFSTAVTVSTRKRNAHTGAISTSARFLMNSNLLPKHIREKQIEERIEQFKIKAVLER